MKKLLCASFIALTAVCTLTTAALADTFAYENTGVGDFGVLDLNTGVFSLLGNSGLTLAGLAYQGATLYGVSYNGGSALYVVNRSNGGVSFIGNSGVVYDDFGSALNTLYAVGTDAILYSINTSTGAASTIGSTGLSLGGFRALSNGGNALYFADGTNIYILNTSTGEATLVGATGGAGVGALVFINGTLYAGEDAPAIRVGTVNPATGAVTDGAVVTGTSGQFYGLAAVPEPATWLLFAAGALCVLARKRRRTT